MVQNDIYTLGIDIGSTTVKIAVLDHDNEVLFSDYERHFANIQETLSDLLGRAIHKLGAFRTMHLRQMWLLNLAVRMPRLFILKAVISNNV